MLQIIAVAAFAVGTALAAPHTVALVGKDMDNAVRLPGMFLAEAEVVDSLPDKAMVVVDRAAVAVDNIAVVAVVAPCQRRPEIPI